MSLKLIELQVALPRSQDAGKIYDQLQHRGQQIQQKQTQEAKEVDKMQRKQVNRQNSSEKMMLKHNNPSKNQSQFNLENKEKEINTPNIHPYKGNAVDIVG
ncbi:hypothetical protein LCL95_03485 [Bacillus timonensis]|nr:hypothetical protein [Bacillus timonensis]